MNSPVKIIRDKSGTLSLVTSKYVKHSSRGKSTIHLKQWELEALHVEVCDMLQRIGKGHEFPNKT